MELKDAYEEAQERRISEYDKMKLKDWGMKGFHYNTYLVSGLEKIDAFYDDPFSTYMLRYSRDIIESEYIVFIGMSLIDYHVNLFFNRRAMPKKKVIFVTKSDSDNFLEIIQNETEGARSFGLLTGGICTIKSENKEELREKGYTIFEKNKLCVYIDGTEKFYENHAEVFNAFE